MLFMYGKSEANLTLFSFVDDFKTYIGGRNKRTLQLNGINMWKTLLKNDSIHVDICGLSK